MATEYVLSYSVEFDVKGGSVVVAALEADENSFVKKQRVTPQGWSLEASCDLPNSGWVRYSNDEPFLTVELERMAVFIDALDRAVILMGPDTKKKEGE